MSFLADAGTAPTIQRPAMRDMAARCRCQSPLTAAQWPERWKIPW